MAEWVFTAKTYPNHTATGDLTKDGVVIMENSRRGSILDYVETWGLLDDTFVDDMRLIDDKEGRRHFMTVGSLCVLRSDMYQRETLNREALSKPVNT